MKSVNRRVPTRIIFITGTDTGVGKTLLTGLLLHHLRESGCHALAMKPFCSGGTSDVDLLGRLQGGELSPRELNPFYFPDPLAPLVAARAQGQRIRLGEVLRLVRVLARRCECLLIEGSGGLLVPLGEGFSALELIASLKCEVIVVARNRLGVINHVRLTLSALRALTRSPSKVVLMGTGHPDPSADTNARALAELVKPATIYALKHLERPTVSATRVGLAARRLRRDLARIIKGG